MDITKIMEHIEAHRPSAAYLGKNQVDALKEEARKAGTEYIEEEETNDGRDIPAIEYFGCTIYTVNVNNHTFFSPERA